MTTKVTKIGKSAVPPLRPLGDAGLALWASVHADSIITDNASLELLTQACEAADVVADGQRHIAEEGTVVVAGNGALKAHPMHPVMVANRALIGRLFKQLGLGLEPIQDVGHPTGGGWRG